MNNIKSFDEHIGYVLERVAYDNVLNEKKSKGIRGFFNKRAARKVRSELSDEIEMSKTIMNGIKEGLETLSDNFEQIKKNMDSSDNRKKGEKEKLLDDITKILEKSKKSTWDLNELIDEGEIDYAGFTANIGLASVAYFGILFTPFRATILMHKGYKYFFNIVKNTVRKSLVMLQLNFDQFSNLIVTQSLKTAGVITASDVSSEIDTFYGNITAQIAENKSLTKTQIQKFNTALKTAKDKFEQQRKSINAQSNAESLYNNLNPYDNTYTKSLEALRQYSADDVQKHLDAIKNSMNKFAGQEADLQTFSELILAAAEEHAYEVSTSIYNKFAKMTEVFSLPNQQKLIDLILEANKEKKREAKKLKDEKGKAKELQEDIDKTVGIEDEGLKVFKSIKGVEIEDPESGNEEDKGKRKYDTSKIKADVWTYDEYEKLKKEDRDSLENWFDLHPEILDKCDATLQIYFKTPVSLSSVTQNTSYIDSLIDYIQPCVKEIEVEESSEAHILTFDEFIFEEKIAPKGFSSTDTATEVEEEGEDETFGLSKKVREELDKQIDEINDDLGKLLKLIYGEEVFKEITTFEDLKDLKITKETEAKLKYVLSKYKAEAEEEESTPRPGRSKKASVVLGLERIKEGIKKKRTKYSLLFNEDSLDDNELSNIRELYKKKKVAVAGLKAIGEKLLNSKTFVENSENLVNVINDAIKKRNDGVVISFMTAINIADAAESLNKLRKTDYVTGLDDENTNNKKSEK